MFNSTCPIRTDGFSRILFALGIRRFLTFLSSISYIYDLRLILKQMGRHQAGTLFNVFRRFREAVLQRSEVRQILIDYWMGHSNPSMGDRYGRQLVEDIDYRQDQIKRLVSVSSFPNRYLGYVGTNFGRYGSGVMNNPMKIREKVVGAKGFEPSTSWSRTKYLTPINALSGVAYGTRSVISPLLVVRKLSVTQ